MRRAAVAVSMLALVVCLGSAHAEDVVKGRVTFSGRAEAPEVITMTADHHCLQAHEQGFSWSPVMTDAKGGLANVFIYVSKGLEGKKYSAPAEPKALLDQKGCWYYPHVSGIMVKQKLEIVNSDPTLHNINALPEFAAAMPPSLKKIEKSFSKPKVMFKVHCNVHPWMFAYIGVVTNPFYAVTGPDGSFEIKGLPPGNYTLEAWHEKLGTRTMNVTVGPSGVVKADFKFDDSSRG